GRVALYLADHLPRLLPPTTARPQPDRDNGLADRESAILDGLRARGASFFGPLHEAVGAGDPGETVDALWNLVWQGLVTNDTFHALRAFTRTRAPHRKARRTNAPSAVRSRRIAPPAAEGRWSLVRPDL